MRDLKQYWAEVREMERNLPPFVWLMSLEDEWRGHHGGVLTEVPAEAAAKLLHDKSHRLATPEEIAANNDHRAAAIRQQFNDRLRREGITVVPLPQPEPPALATPEPPPRVRSRNLR